MKEKNKISWGAIGLFLILIIGLVLGFYEGYQRGHAQGLIDAKSPVYVYYDEWKNVYYDEWKNITSEGDIYSEYLSYGGSTYSAFKGNNDYSISFSQVKSPESFEITVDTDFKSCRLHIINSTCYSEFKVNIAAGEYYPTNCDKNYVIGNKAGWLI